MTLLHEPLRAVPPAEPAAVVFRGVSKRYGGVSGTTALAGVSFTAHAGEFLCLVGPSGCGKSTVLNLIAGLDRASSGTVATPGGKAALMFQDAALFPWLTVAENVEFPLKLRRIGRGERRRRVAELLHLVRLEGSGGKRPHELSGGMRQRVALARALAQETRLLLMDEPFGSLDPLTRDLLHDELERVWRETALSLIFVTHNVREAVRLGDRVLLLGGRPAQVAAEFAVDLPRPRDMESLAVAGLASRITERLREQAQADDGLVLGAQLEDEDRDASA